MTNIDIEHLNSKYEQKRRKAINEQEERIKSIYIKIPRLEEIDNEINKLSIEKTKNILLHNVDAIVNNEIEKKIMDLKNEKKNIFIKNNINDNFFKPKFECNKCQDRGYILYKDKKTEMCSCYKQQLLNISYNKSNLSNLKKENFENFNLNKFSDEINIEKYKINISPRQNINMIKQACENFINNFDSMEVKNLFFTGNTGLGKTYMTNCIANELIKKGKTVLYQTAPVLLESIIDAKFSKYKKNDMSNFVNQILEADLLIIDDLGTECLNSMKISELFTILNTRSLNLNNKVTKTIISSNLSIEKIFEVYEERIGSRIAGFYDIYYFFGDDLRLMNS